MKLREEKDTMGTVHVPENAYFGPQTQRAVENFPISGLKLPSAFIYALALIKKFYLKACYQKSLMVKNSI